MKQFTKPYRIAIYLISYVLISASTIAQIDYTTAIKESRNLLIETLKEYPGVSISVVVDQEIVWKEGLGYSNTATKEKVKPDHRFLYYSLSKSILGVAIYRLQNQGILDIDNPITNYLKDLPEQYQNVTARQLLGHTAGVRHYKKGEWSMLSQEKCLTTDEAIRVFINDPLAFEPGSTYQYSSFGYVLLSHLIEQITGDTFDVHMDKLFENYSINSIARPVDSTPADMQATRYEKWNSKKERGIEAVVNNSCKFGGGGFIGTASDLAMFHARILEEEKGNQKSTLYSTLNQDGLTSYGYGIGINKKTENVYYAHTGSGKGGSSVLIIYPKYDLVIVLLGNIKGDALTASIGQIGNNFKKAISN